MINFINKIKSENKDRKFFSNGDLELKNILSNDNSFKEIIEIFDKCIENTYRAIDIEDIEEDFPNLDTNIYIENYKKILILIKNILIKNYKNIGEKQKKTLLSKLESDAKNKFKIEIAEIIMFFEIILDKAIGYKNIKISYDDVMSFCIGAEENKTD